MRQLTVSHILAAQSSKRLAHAIAPQETLAPQPYALSSGLLIPAGGPNAIILIGAISGPHILHHLTVRATVNAEPTLFVDILYSQASNADQAAIDTDPRASGQTNPRQGFPANVPYNHFTLAVRLPGPTTYLKLLGLSTRPTAIGIRAILTLHRLFAT